jgi:catechol 2,3-dioxygenase-like lactoylglutathione lyase family enzyme
MFLEHVNLSVSDLERSIAFYSRLLDLEVRWRGTTTDGLPAAHIGDQRSYLALFGGASGERAPNDYDVLGINHIGFVVEDLDAARQRLRALGADPHFEADYEPGQRLYFFDPDGIEVELVHYDRVQRRPD